MHRSADSGPADLERLVRLTARLLHAPIAVLARLEGDRIRMTSSADRPIDEDGAVAAFIGRAMAANGALLEADLAPSSEQWCENGAGSEACFVAGVGLGGTAVLCVVDNRRRRLSTTERQDLADMAAVATRLLSAEPVPRAAGNGDWAERLASLVECLPFDFWLCDGDGRYLLQSAVGRRRWGDHVGLLPNQTAVPAEVRAYWAESNRRVLAGETIRGEKAYLAGADVVHVEELLAPARNAAGTIWGLIGLNIEIGERKRAEARLAEAEARLRAAIESLPFDFWITDAAGRYVMNNATCREHWGTHLGQRPDETDVDPAVTRLWDETNRRVLAGETLRYEATYGAGDGRRDVEAILAPVQAEGRIIGLVGVNIDISERKRAEERMRHLADHDALTGLPNRRRFQDRLAHAISRSRRRDEVMALLLLDLDAFKSVNDAFGHDTGDALLCEVARRLRVERREEDTVARFGGDEFALILEGLRQPTDASLIAGRIMAELRQPFRYRDQELQPCGSIGIALYPGDGRSAGDLLKHADIALYRAKQSGRGEFQHFEAEMRVQVDRRRRIEADLRRALAGGEFTVFYQPIVDLARPRSLSFEALLRWQHPDRGLVLPGEFLQVAEETGLVVPIGQLVLERVAQQTRSWADRGVPVGKIAINVADAQFGHGDLDAKVAATLAAEQLPADHLEIEVTEGVFLGRNAGMVEQLLHRLHARGVSIVLDDFGTGHASLTHLRRFPIDKLKIDRTFVRDMLDDPNDAIIVRAIIDLGHSLGIEIVAEGVETRAQLEFLRRHGCDHIQGYLVATPAPAAEALEHASTNGLRALAPAANG